MKYMKKYIWLPVIAILTLQLACVLTASGARTGSGNVLSMDETYRDFTALDISHTFDVIIEQGDGFTVTIRADDNFVEDLDVRVQGDVLKVGLKPSFNNLIQDSTLEARITMPALSAIELSGASVAEISGFSSKDSFSVDVSGASSLRGDIVAGNTFLDVSGASRVNLFGSGTDLRADASGASTIDLSEFTVTDATIDASSASDVTVNVNGTLNADASGASNISYLGNPTLGTINTSGASSVGAE